MAATGAASGALRSFILWVGPGKQILIARQLSLRGEFVDHSWQQLRELCKQVIARHAGLPGQMIDRLWAERALQLIGRNGLVLACANPRFEDVFEPALTEAVDQSSQPTKISLRLTAKISSLRLLRADASKGS
jgi:hypothetical protein